MIEDLDKIANVALHQRTDLMVKLERMEREFSLLHDALVDIRELVDGEADVDDGMPNTAMRVLVVVKLALREDV
jgi:hypothetical protein